MTVSSVRQKILNFDGDSRTALPPWPMYSPFTINNVRGVSGCSTTQTIARLAGYGYLYPAAAIIEVGINDLPLYGITEATTIANIKTIIDWYQACAERVYVCSTYPTNIATYMTGPLKDAAWANVPFLTGLNASMENVSNAIQSYCVGKPKVTFIDLRPTSSPSGELLSAYTYDGVHGTSLMNQLIIDSVMAYENNY
jgi:lysophospholipase L1-like esterase